MSLVLRYWQFASYFTTLFVFHSNLNSSSVDGAPPLIVGGFLFICPCHLRWAPNHLECKKEINYTSFLFFIRCPLIPTQNTLLTRFKNKKKQTRRRKKRKKLYIVYGLCRSVTQLKIFLSRRSVTGTGTNSRTR